MEYAHGQGHSPFGFGWRLGVRAIARRLDLGVPNGVSQSASPIRAEIVPMVDGSYRALAETAFSRYTRIGQGPQFGLED